MPIIEPIKEDLPALKRGLAALMEHDCRFILIANPCVGELQEDSSSLRTEIIDDQLSEYQNFSVGLNLCAGDSLDVADKLFEQYHMPIAVVHRGFSDGKGLSAIIQERAPNITEHVFVETDGTPRTLYRKHFQGSRRVIVHDGFVAQVNRSYPPEEPFSELYLTYAEMNCDAFGDFLIAGNDFREGGGPAYAIAIHLTYADPEADDAIAIKHYISDRVHTPKDPAGKYMEALQKLVDDVQASDLICRTTAVDEYLQLHDRQHFPGLGYTKKLSMQHHIELMANLLNVAG